MKHFLQTTLIAIQLLALSAPSMGATVSFELTAKGTPSSEIVILAHPVGTMPALVPTTNKSIAQQKKQFTPKVTVVAQGSSVLFPNLDTVRHHVYSFSEPKNFEIKLYTGTPASPIVFDKPGVVVLGCNIHDNMTAWLVVSPTPYFTQTDEQGKATLELPPGSYKLDFFHPERPANAPFENKTFTVKDSTSVYKADISLK